MADDLSYLRCPRGCDPRFIDYLTWEGTNLRVADSKTQYRRWGKTVRRAGETPYPTVWTLGLRCCDCSKVWRIEEVPDAVKRALDEHLDNVAHAIQDLVDQIDGEGLDAALNGVARLMEDNR